jgi:hypothetical protein
VSKQVQGEHIFFYFFFPCMYQYLLMSSHLRLSSLDHTPFGGAQQASTITTYASTMTRVLLMLMRPRLPGYPISVPGHLGELLVQLEEAHTQEEQQPEHNRLIHQIFKALFMQRWRPVDDDDSMPNPTGRALALMSLKEDGSFHDAHHITSPIAGLEYCIRSMAVAEISELCAADPRLDELEVGKEVCKWLVEEHDSTFSLIRSLQHLASSIAIKAQSLPKVWWLDRKNWTEMLFKGERVRLGDVQQMFGVVLSDIVQTWERDVLLGVKLRVDYKDIKDDLTNSDVNYCFLSDPANAAFSDRQQLLRAFLDSPECRQKLFLTNVDGRAFAWNIPELHAWLRALAKLEGLLLMVSDMLTGAPPRGTEVWSMNYRNTKGRLRNMYAFDKYTALVRMYTKTSSMSGQDKLIPHVMDALSSDILIQVLALARPFAELICPHVFPGNAEAALLYKEAMWVNYGKRFDSEKMSRNLSDYTGTHLGPRMGIRDWRHYLAASQRHLCSQLDEDEQEAAEVRALQFGHSSETHNRIYGLSSENALGVSEDILPLFMQHSVEWQVVGRVIPGMNLDVFGWPSPHHLILVHHQVALVFPTTRLRQTSLQHGKRARRASLD